MKCISKWYLLADKNTEQCCSPAPERMAHLARDPPGGHSLESGGLLGFANLTGTKVSPRCVGVISSQASDHISQNSRGRK